LSPPQCSEPPQSDLVDQSHHVLSLLTSGVPAQSCKTPKLDPLDELHQNNTHVGKFCIEKDLQKQESTLSEAQHDIEAMITDRSVSAVLSITHAESDHIKSEMDVLSLKHNATSASSKKNENTSCRTPCTVPDDNIESEDDAFETETTNSTMTSMISTWPGTPNTAEREGLLSPVLGLARRRIIDRLMSEIHALLDQHIEFRSRSGSTESSHSQAPSPFLPDQSTKASSSGRKRPNDRGEGSEIPGNDPGDNRSSKRLRISSPEPVIQPRKLACPYYKRSPRKHQKYRSCAGPGWMSCHRVK